MLRCNKCILPDNYPGIKFNKNGICNYCTDHKEKKYLGGKALRKKYYHISKIMRIEIMTASSVLAEVEIVLTYCIILSQS